MNNNIEKRISNLEKMMEVFGLPLISEYRVLAFHGLADGTPLTLSNGITIADIRNRIFVLKSLKIIPYYSANGIDISLTDGVTTTNEITFNNTRVERVFDFITVGTFLSVAINGSNLPMFHNVGGAAGGYPLDLFIDNILYKFPEKLQTLGVSVNSRAVLDLTTGAADTPNVKVIIECYLI
jgi:hypothetical protein